jgi:hypothetical protein
MTQKTAEERYQLGLEVVEKVYGPGNTTMTFKGIQAARANVKAAKKT